MDRVSKKEDSTRKCYFMFSLLLIVLFSAIASAQTENSSNVTGYQEDYYFTDGEFSEEYNFTNESISNIVMTIPQDYQSIEAGSELLTSIKIMNLGSRRREDVVLKFDINSIDGKLLLTKKETVAVETQANFVRIFEIPADAKAEKYTVHVTLTHANGKEAVAEAFFKIVDKKAELYNKIYLIAGVVVVIGFIVLLITKSGAWLEKRRLKRKIRRIVRNRMKMLAKEK